MAIQKEIGTKSNRNWKPESDSRSTDGQLGTGRDRTATRRDATRTAPHRSRPVTVQSLLSLHRSPRLAVRHGRSACPVPSARSAPLRPAPPRPVPGGGPWGWGRAAGACERTVTTVGPRAPLSGAGSGAVRAERTEGGRGEGSER